jgi:hypothetical protein
MSTGPKEVSGLIWFRSHSRKEREQKCNSCSYHKLLQNNSNTKNRTKNKQQIAVKAIFGINSAGPIYVTYQNKHLLHFM